jgi:hypothetical protein
MIGLGLGLTSTAAVSGVYSPPVEAILQLGRQGVTVGGNLDNARSSTATVVDYNNREWTAKVGETRQQGARRVEQKLVQTENFAHAAWQRTAGGTGSVAQKTPNYGAAPDNTTTGCRVYLNKGAGSTANDFSRFFQTFDAVVSGRGSVYIRSATSSSYVVGLGTDNVLNTITVTPTWQRFTHDVDAGSATQLQIEVRGGLSHSSIADLVVWHPMFEDKFNALVAAPSDYIHDNTEYNATCLGVAYHDTTNGNSVVNNVVISGVGGSVSPTPYYLLEPAATNFFLNSNAPTTQTIALTAGQYTIALTGSGSVTLSGGASGTVSSSAPLTFTATTDVTFTVSGTVTRVQVESGAKATSHIPTTGAAASRSADSLFLPAVAGTNWIQNSGLLLIKFTPMYNAAETSNTPIFNNVSIDASNGYRVTDGTNTVTSAVSNAVSGQPVIFAFIWDFDETVMAVAYSNNGGTTYPTWHQEAYDGAMPLTTNFEWFKNNVFVNRLYTTRVYNTVGKTLGQMQSWVQQNAAGELM